MQNQGIGRGLAMSRDRAVKRVGILNSDICGYLVGAAGLGEPTSSLEWWEELFPGLGK